MLKKTAKAWATSLGARFGSGFSGGCGRSSGGCGGKL